MKTVIHLGDNPVTLRYASFDEEVDVDELLKIEYSNLYGETVTMPTLVNRFGLLKAEAEHSYNNKKLDFEIYESQIRQEIRSKYSQADAKKLTEKALDEEVVLDKPWQIKKKQVLQAKKNVDMMDVLYFAAQDKSRKLNVLVRPVTPEELFNELIDGTINGIAIKKVKSLLDKTK